MGSAPDEGQAAINVDVANHAHRPRPHRNRAHSLAGAFRDLPKIAPGAGCVGEHAAQTLTRFPLWTQAATRETALSGARADGAMSISFVLHTFSSASSAVQYRGIERRHPPVFPRGLREQLGRSHSRVVVAMNGGLEDIARAAVHAAVGEALGLQYGLVRGHAGSFVSA